MGDTALNDPAPDAITCTASDGFIEFMAASPGALAVTTYQAGKVALVGYDPKSSQLSLLLRQFDKPLGLAVGQSGRTMALATRHEILVFADAPLLAEDYLEHRRGAYDALYLPRVSHHTGDLNIHDLAYAADDALWFVNTRFSCLSAVSAHYSFVPLWKPPFISELAPEDRCHLNGLAMVEGRPKYVTCLGESDTPGGWRPGKASGGVVVDIDTGQVALRGLSMPHSPRWHAGKLWVLNSGTGELLVASPADWKPQSVCSLPGYLRGLCFVGDHHAVVGLCQVREKHIFGDLPVQRDHARLLCAIAAVDLRTGRAAGMLEFTSGVQELYDVQLLPGVRRPMLLNLQKDATRQAFTAPQFSYWLRPSSLIADQSRC